MLIGLKIVDDRTIFIRDDPTWYKLGLLPRTEWIKDFNRWFPIPDKESLIWQLLKRHSQLLLKILLSFWNDLLRNDYSGYGFITGGRKTNHPLAIYLTGEKKQALLTPKMVKETGNQRGIGRIYLKEI